jgi:hypothetical protein
MAGFESWGPVATPGVMAGSESTGPVAASASMAGFDRREGATGIPAALKYPPAVSRLTPVAASIRRNVQPSLPRARTSCFFSSLKTLLIRRA